MTHRLATTLGAIAAALTVSGSVALASAPSAANARFVAVGSRAHSSANCSDVYGRGWADSALAAMARSTTAQSAANSDATDEDTDTDEGSSDNGRPQNHGWFVSQAAHDKSTTGADHGKAVSAVARGNAGKP